MPWILLILLAAPLVLGLLWGACLGRRDSFSWPLLLAAPILSGVLTVGVLAVI